MFKRTPFRVGCGPAWMAALGLCLLPLVNCGGGSSPAPDGEPGILSLKADAPAVPPGKLVTVRLRPRLDWDEPQSDSWTCSPGWIVVGSNTSTTVAVLAPATEGTLGTVQVIATGLTSGEQVYGAATVLTTGSGATETLLPAAWETGLDPDGTESYTVIDQLRSMGPLISGFSMTFQPPEARSSGISAPKIQLARAPSGTLGYSRAPRSAPSTSCRGSTAGRSPAGFSSGMAGTAGPGRSPAGS
jgi:hypothetical protein